MGSFKLLAGALDFRKNLGALRFPDIALWFKVTLGDVRFDPPCEFTHTLKASVADGLL